MTASRSTGIAFEQQTGPWDTDSLRAIALIVATVIALFVIRMTGYPSLFGNGKRIGAYVLDAVQNGNWIAQRDSTGEIASKPPLLTWSVALTTLLTGKITRWALYLPTAISTGAVGLVLLVAGRKLFEWRAGFLAAFAYVPISF